MKLLRTTRGSILDIDGQHYPITGPTWDDLVISNDLPRTLNEARAAAAIASDDALSPLAPIVSQEVWAAGVTYLRSKQARMEESETAGGGTFYDRVYAAPRPEIFFKATPHRVVGTEQPVRIRKDSAWNVPEPELALLVNPRGRIVGYTIGNDMSSRDIEGENPLYLPQAKVYDGCCALGPAVLIAGAEPLPKSTQIHMDILRDQDHVFRGWTSLSQMKREFDELVEYLFRDNSFPHGCYLLTGTGVIPPDDFTLKPGDEIRITIEPIGTLRNVVA